MWIIQIVLGVVNVGIMRNTRPHAILFLSSSIKSFLFFPQRASILIHALMANGASMSPSFTNECGCTFILVLDPS